MLRSTTPRACLPGAALAGPERYAFDPTIPACTAEEGHLHSAACPCAWPGWSCTHTEGLCVSALCPASARVTLSAVRFLLLLSVIQLAACVCRRSWRTRPQQCSTNRVTELWRVFGTSSRALSMPLGCALQVPADTHADPGKQSHPCAASVADSDPLVTCCLQKVVALAVRLAQLMILTARVRLRRQQQQQRADTTRRAERCAEVYCLKLESLVKLC